MRRSLLVALGLWAATAAGAPPSLEILVLDDYGADQFPPHARRGWLALCEGRLRAVEVTTRPVPSEIAPMVRVAASPCADAPLLVRGAGVSERAVPTATTTVAGEGAHRRVTLRLGRRRLTLRLVGAADQPQWLELDDGGQRIRVAGGDDWTAEDWTLLWAGDLDGDGAIDFAVRLRGDGDRVELFLSSRATAGGRVGLAAQTFLGGC